MREITEITDSTGRVLQIAEGKIDPDEALCEIVFVTRTQAGTYKADRRVRDTRGGHRQAAHAMAMRGWSDEAIARETGLSIAQVRVIIAQKGGRAHRTAGIKT